MADLFERAELQQRRKEKMIEKALKEREAQELAACTFSPRVNNPREPLDPDQIDESSQRLYEDRQIYENRRKRKEAEQMKKQCPFTPKTNHKRDPDDEVDAEAMSDKLFDEFKLKDKRLMVLKRRFAKAECPFTPKTNHPPRDDDDPVDTEAISQKLYEEYALKEKRRGAKEKLYMKAHCTFQPSLVAKNKDGRKGADDEELDPEHVAKTVQRLFDDAKLHEERVKKERAALLKVEARKCPHSPKTNREPEELEPEQVEESVESLFGEHKLNNDRRVKALKFRHEIELRTCTFKPELDKEKIGAQFLKDRERRVKEQIHPIISQPSRLAKSMPPAEIPRSPRSGYSATSPKTASSPGSRGSRTPRGSTGTPRSPQFGSGWSSPGSPISRIQSEGRGSEASSVCSSQ